MKGRRKQQAFTLIELMVASSLALVILTLVVMLFIPALRAWTDGQNRSEVGQSLLVTSTWIGDDVVRSSPGSLKLLAPDVLLMKCALGQTDSDSNPFNQQVAYYLEGGELFRTTRRLGEADPEPTVPEIKALADKRRVASNVTAFEVTIKPEQPWRLELHVAVNKEGRKGEIRTGYSSIYAPFDIEIAAKNTKTRRP